MNSVNFSIYSKMIANFCRLTSQCICTFFVLVSSASNANAQTNSKFFPLITDAENGQVVVLDSDAFSVQQKINFPFSIHPQLLHSPDQHYVFLSSPDGWLIKLDLQTQKITQQIRVGLSTSAIALSHDGRFIMVANLHPTTLVAIDAVNFASLRTIEVKDKAGKASSVVGIHTAPERKSFIAVMQGIAELWELSYDQHAEPVYEGLVHDYKMAEAIAIPGPFAPRRIILENVLNQFIFAQNFTQAIGSDDAGLMQVINLNIRRKIHEQRFSSKVKVGAAAIWQWHGHQVLALPQANEKLVKFIDMQTWEVLKKIEVDTDSLQIQTHAGARYAWMGNKLLDKQSLTMLTPTPSIIAASSAPLGWVNNGSAVIVKSRDQKSLLLIDTYTLKVLQRCTLTDTENSSKASSASQ